MVEMVRDNCNCNHHFYKLNSNLLPAKSRAKNRIGYSKPFDPKYSHSQSANHSFISPSPYDFHDFYPTEPPKKLTAIRIPRLIRLPRSRISSLVTLKEAPDPLLQLYQSLRTRYLETRMTRRLWFGR